MRKWEIAAIKRKKEIDIADEKATDLDIIVQEVMKLPYGQLKKVLTPAVMEVLKKYGYTSV
jgi:hypothetical protein